MTKVLWTQATWGKKSHRNINLKWYVSLLLFPSACERGVHSQESDTRASRCQACRLVGEAIIYKSLRLRFRYLSDQPPEVFSSNEYLLNIYFFNKVTR